ncbi:fibronectin type III domain-containing protein [Flavobacterium oreochromis]|uniref:fibronectin type III domain-containing protein n=1 Tax=Flavobacterium oreochromis TaxID=2906078 RepID=UPI00385B1B28
MIFKSKGAVVIFTQLMILSHVIAYSQSPKVQLLARGQKDRILLRWGITSASEWKKSLKTGYYLTRYTIKKGNQILTTPEKKVLSIEPIKPEPLEKWEELIKRDQYAAILAQSIYGEDFEITGQNDNTISRIIDSSDKLEQRFSFGLYAADMSFEGALKAGLGFVDTSIVKSETYVYQLTVAGKNTLKPTSVMMGIRDYKKLPAVDDVVAVADDKKVIVSWDFDTYKSIFSSYKIERSEDGVNFKSITNTPIVNMNEQKGVISKRMFYVDTLAQNDKIYHYKLYGISAFGEKGQDSKVLAAKGIHDVFLPSRITDYHITKENSVLLEWEYPKELEEHIAGFEINHAEDDKAVYQKVSDMILPSIRKFEHKNLAGSNYYKIVVLGKNNKRLNSQSILVQPIDSLPPARPIGLTGVIDSLGTIKLKWQANIEKDLRGYRILKANNPNEEFVDIYKKSFIGTSFEDKVSLKMSNPKVYYKIAAEDNRFNISEPSEVLVLEKPDVIPPAPPIFKNYTIVNGAIQLDWIRSYSEDVSQHILKRRKAGETKWQELIKVSDTTQTYLDKDLENKTTYQYAIVAKDKTNLESALDNAIVTIPFVSMKPVDLIQNFIGTVDREQRKIILNWSFAKTKEKIQGISIYRNQLGEPPMLWKELSKPVDTIDDIGLAINKEYEYHLMILLENNTPVKSESVIVKY